jgi:hypothetical protein
MRRWVLFAFLLLTGCASEPNYPLRSHAIQPITPDHMPGAVALPPGTTFGTWRATPSRLAEDIPRAVKRLSWGLLEVSLPPSEGPGATGATVRAEALLPDNRIAVIHGWKLSETEIAVGVRIGRFGDAAIEQEFLQMLADALAGRAAPKRGGTFTLPANWPSD